MSHSRAGAIIALVILMSCAAPLRAQDTFLVMSAKGKVEYSTGKSGKWKKLEIGQTLKKGDVVRTSFASYVKLMLNAQRLLSIDENTTSPLAEFVKSKGGGADNASGKILAWASQSMSKSKQRKTGPDFGAVRGGMGVFSAVFPTQSILTDAPTFQWIDTDSAADYQILVLDESYQVVDRRDAKGYSISAEPRKLANGKTYHWQVTRITDGEIANVQSFTIVPKDTAQAVAREIESLDKELAKMNADEVTRHLIHAVYYEHKGLYQDAFAEYRETIRLAPDVEEYRSMLRNLLVTLRLLGEEEYLLR
jgi:hypothetical protein